MEVFTVAKARGTSAKWQDEYVDVETLRQLIEGVSSGSIAPDEAVERLKRLPFSDVGDTLVDHHRHLRQVHPKPFTGRARAPNNAS